MQDHQASDANETASHGAGTDAHKLTDHPVSHDQQASEAANEHRPHEGEQAERIADAAMHDIARRVEQLEQLPAHVAEMVGQIKQALDTFSQLADRVTSLESAVAGAVNDLAQFEQKLSTSDAYAVAQELAALKKRLAGFIH